jgi:DNA-directed RNA polymerase subunit M/transcription elongation factor TFIIS
MYGSNSMINDTLVQLVIPTVTATCRTVCPECGSTQARPVWKAVDRTSEAATRSFSCERCHHYWVEEVPA